MKEIQVNCVSFLIKNLCIADLSSAECSGQIPIPEETGQFFGAHIWVKLGGVRCRIRE